MPGVVLTLFGFPTAHVGGAAGGQPLRLGAKSLGLLIFLALEPGPHLRERLASLLWGEFSDDNARTSLRQALRQLRDALGDLIEADRQTVRLTAPVESDVAAFLGACQSGSIDALGFEVPSFLRGLSVSGAPDFEEWIDSRREQLMRRWLGVVREMARSAVLRSRWREAFALSERWLGADPLNEEATAIAMEATYCLGDRAGALAQYRRYRELIQRELGSRPTETLRDLAARIEQAAAPTTPSDETEFETARQRFEADLVGRESQWLALTALWDRAARGKGAIAVLEGESGAGKSRLAEEFVRWAGGHGATVLRGHGYEPSGGAPFGPVAAALGTGLNAAGLAGTSPEWLVEVARLVPDLRRRFPGLPAAPEGTVGARSRLFEGVAQMLLSLAAEHPTVLLLDDLHWCDGDSCALLHFLADRLSESPVMVLATATAGGLERGTPADQLIRRLTSRRRASVIEVGPLSETEVWEVIRQMGNVRTPTGARRFARRIHEVTGGNPFYVIELVKTLFSQRLLSATPISQEWIVPSDTNLTDFTTLPMPRSVRDAIGERVSLLNDELRDLLATLAVAARPVSLDVLAHIHGMSRMRVAALGSRLVERHLAVECDGMFRTAHAVLGDVVRSSLAASHRTELHRVVSLALEIVTPPERMGEVAGEIAWHAERAGDLERAAAFGRAVCREKAPFGVIPEVGVGIAEQDVDLRVE
ncbi:MAG TPA: AAA family ATPase [Gemmatimonadales bacterium]|nr:AAA family ATPase [Gemmatimonadales bacterium]